MEMIVPSVAYPYTAASNNRVHSLTGLLQPSGLTLAGLSKDGVVVQAEQTGHIGTAREKVGLLRSGALLKHIYFLPEALLLTPAAIFKEEEATTWLCQLFPCLPAAVKSIYLSKSALHLTYAEEPSLQDELSPLQQELTLRPLPQCLLESPAEGFLFCLLDAMAVGVLHLNGQLRWYQQFEYTTPEDVLWQALSAAQDAGLHPQGLQLQVLGVSPQTAAVAATLANYFAMSEPAADPWDPVLALFQKMSTCAS